MRYCFILVSWFIITNFSNNHQHMLLVFSFQWFKLHIAFQSLNCSGFIIISPLHILIHIKGAISKDTYEFNDRFLFTHKGTSSPALHRWTSSPRFLTMWFIYLGSWPNFLMLFLREETIYLEMFSSFLFNVDTSFSSIR